MYVNFAHRVLNIIDWEMKEKDQNVKETIRELW